MKMLTHRRGDGLYCLTLNGDIINCKFLVLEISKKRERMAAQFSGPERLENSWP